MSNLKLSHYLVYLRVHYIDHGDVSVVDSKQHHSLITTVVEYSDRKSLLFVTPCPEPDTSPFTTRTHIGSKNKLLKEHVPSIQLSQQHSSAS